MKKTVKLLALALGAASLCGALSACSGGVDGEYAIAMDSKTYFSAQEVINDMPETELRPDGSEAMVPFVRLFPMLDSRVTDDVAGTSAEAGVADFYDVNLTLDGESYTLTKHFNFDMEYVSADVKDMMSTADAPSIEVSFTGSYTADGDTVTLAAPTGITANVTPVAGIADSYTRFGGTYMDVTETAAADDTYPGKFFYYFNTPYFVENADISDMTVTLDKEAGTFSIS